MPGPYLPGLIRVSAIYTHPSLGNASNVFHIRPVEGQTPEIATQGFVDAFRAGWEGTGDFLNFGLRTVVANGLVLSGLNYLHMDVPDGAAGSYAGSALAGSGSQMLPPDLAACVSWLSGQNGRKGRGRSFIGPLASGALNAATGRIAQSNVDVLTGWANRLIIEAFSGGAEMVVYSRVGGGLLTPISGASVDTHFDVQRRRGD